MWWPITSHRWLVATSTLLSRNRPFKGWRRTLHIKMMLRQLRPVELFSSLSSVWMIVSCRSSSSSSWEGRTDSTNQRFFWGRGWSLLSSTNFSIGWLVDFFLGWSSTFYLPFLESLEILGSGNLRRGTQTFSRACVMVSIITYIWASRVATRLMRPPLHV